MLPTLRNATNMSASATLRTSLFIGPKLKKHSPTWSETASDHPTEPKRRKQRLKRDLDSLEGN